MKLFVEDVAILTDLEREGAIPLKCKMGLDRDMLSITYEGSRDGWILKVPVDALKKVILEDDLK